MVKKVMVGSLFVASVLSAADVKLNLSTQYGKETSGVKSSLTSLEDGKSTGNIELTVNHHNESDSFAVKSGVGSYIARNSNSSFRVYGLVGYQVNDIEGFIY